VNGGPILINAEEKRFDEEENTRSKKVTEGDPKEKKYQPEFWKTFEARHSREQRQMDWWGQKKRWEDTLLVERGEDS